MLLSRLVDTYKELGAVDTFISVCNRALGKITRRQALIYKYYVTEQKVTKISLVPLGKGKDLEVREVLSDDPVCTQLDRPPSAIHARFRQGGHCYAAFRKGELAGYLWLNFGRYREDEVRCIYDLAHPDKSVWDYDVCVLPRHRLSFTFPKLWDYANEVMAGRGIENTYSRIHYHNLGSLSSHKKLGSRIIGSIYFLKFFRWQFSLSGTFRPVLTFSRNARVFPRIRIP